MADLVNPVSAAQLKPRNQEPTHLGGTSWDDIGGTSMNAEPNTAKVNAGAGVKGQDTSIPRSVPAEPSHLKGAKGVKSEEVPSEPTHLKGMKSEEGDPEVSFDDKDETKLHEADDLDKALDEMADEKPVHVKIKEEDDEDEKKDDMKEEKEDDEKKDDMKEEKEDDDDEKKDDMKEEKEEDDEKKGKLKEEVCPDCHKEKCQCESVSESIRVNINLPKASLFESVGFTEKQQKQVATLFESAIKDTTKQLSVKLNEHYKARYAKKSELLEQKLSNRIDTFLTVVAESWMDTNRIAARQSLRADLAESFLNGLQTLFREHYIDVPESKVNVVETLQQEIDKLKGQINEQNATNMKLRRLAEAANKMRIVAEFARNMSEVQAAKLAKLAENTEYVDAKDFREKLSMITESYFEKGERKVTRLPEEDVKVVKEETNTTKSEADLVAEAITRQVKSSW